MPMEKPKSVDAYFSSLEPARRASLQNLREAIAAAAPGAEEGITYGMPGFLLDGRGLVGYMAFERHYSFFPMSPAAIDAHRDALGDLVTGKGTISFEYGRRLPAKLVKQVEDAARRGRRQAVAVRRASCSIRLRERSRDSPLRGPGASVVDGALEDREGGALGIADRPELLAGLPSPHERAAAEVAGTRQRVVDRHGGEVVPRRAARRPRRGSARASRRCGPPRRRRGGSASTAGRRRRRPARSSSRTAPRRTSTRHRRRSWRARWTSGIRDR